MTDEKLYKRIRSNVRTYLEQATLVAFDTGNKKPTDLQILEIAKMIQIEAIESDKH